MELHEAIMNHQLGDIAVAVLGLPVLVQVRQDEDTLPNAHRQVAPHLLRGDGHPLSCFT